MKTLKIYLFLYTILFVCHPVLAQPSDTSTLEDYLVMAAQNNPGLNASFKEYLAALEKVPQVGSLSDPQLTIGFFLRPMELLDGNQVADFQLMQMFPWFGTLKAAKDEASLMAKAKFETFNVNKAELYFRVTSSWYLLCSYDQEIKVQQKIITLLESIEQITLIKFQNPAGNNSSSEKPGSSGMTTNATTNENSGSAEMGNMNSQSATTNNPQVADNMSAGAATSMGTGQSGLSDALLIKMEILKQKNLLALLSDQKLTEVASFNALLNRDLESAVNVADSMVMNKLSVEQMAMIDAVIKNNPMLAMLDTESQSYLSMEKKSRKMGMPMLGIGLEYTLVQKRNDNPSMMNGKDMVMPMVSITLPIYRKKYKAMQNEAKYMYESTVLKREETENMLKLQSYQLIQDLNDASRRTELYEELFSLSRQNADLLITGYAAGSITFEAALGAINDILNNGFKYFEALTDYNIAIARAEKLMNSVNSNK